MVSKTFLRPNHLAFSTSWTTSKRSKKSTSINEDDDDIGQLPRRLSASWNSSISRVSLSNPVISGYLWKKGDKGLLKTWKKRWFYLEDNILYYIKHRSSLNITGKINMLDVVNVEEYAYKSLSKLLTASEDCFFKIIKPERTFILFAESKEERIRWVQVLNETRTRVSKEQLITDWVLVERAVTLTNSGEHQRLFEERKRKKEVPEENDVASPTPYHKTFQNELDFPSYWTDFENYAEIELDANSREFQVIDELMNSNIGTHGNNFGLVDGKDPIGFKVKRIVRIQNSDLWQRYQFLKKFVEKQNEHKLSERESSYYLTQKASLTPVLDLSVNEYYLFHGTKWEVINIVKQKGFDERVGSITGMFGAGIYFAENSSKSNQYIPCPSCGKGAIVNPEPCFCTTQADVGMLLCRVLLGDFHVALHYDSSKYKGADPRSPVRRPPPKTPDGIELYDSVLGESKANGGDTLNYREWIVYDRCQVYPEYVIYFQRIGGTGLDSGQPEEMNY